MGFSLVEVLVAVAILAFVALGVAVLFTRSMTLNASGFDYASLSTEARRTIEELQGLPYDHAKLEPTSSVPHTQTAGQFALRYSVTEHSITRWQDVVRGEPWPVAPRGLGNVKRITLVVRSTADTGRVGKRELTVSALKLRR